ncbi:CaiB/BaiF CoA transferase family protein [Bradyrhizobium erythrophlei]|uniref:CaiB/BaiF CoA transferase family protein n=1 Tax=Bradyrhizobium erythrophlei TaxID=1437360 RepID=UPI0035E52825
MTSVRTSTPAISHPLEGALSRVRVVDFSQIAAGPLCTMLLADMGADVVKIEPPGGDISRTLGPNFAGGESTTFLSLNRNKRSVVLDLKTEQGLMDARSLIETADVLVESFRPGVADRLGIGYAQARALNPKLIYCSVSAYGQSEHGKPGVDGVLQAVSGLMSITGFDGQPPAKLQAPVVDMVTGYQATIAILGALLKRSLGTVPSHLDISLFASALLLQQVPLTDFLISGELPRRCGSGAPYSTPNEAYETADGYIMVAAYQQEHWRKLCRVIDRPELADDQRFATLPRRMDNREELTRQLGLIFRTNDSATWLCALEAADIVCGPIADYAHLQTSQRFATAGIVALVNHPRAGEVEMPGFAIGGPALAVRMPPPILGQHNHLLVRGEADLASAESE